MEKSVVQDHCDDHDEDDVDEAREEARDEGEERSEQRGSESVEPSVSAEPMESVGERSSDLTMVRLLGGDSQGYVGRSAIRGVPAPPSTGRPRGLPHP